MSTSSSVLGLVETSGPEALWLLQGSSLGRLAYVERELVVVRPARHVREYGRPAVRTPAAAAAVTVAVPVAATYHAEEPRAVPGTGWTVTVSGPAEVITDLDGAAHHRRTVAGWTHGPHDTPHDTLLRLQPQSVAGFRLARAGV